MTDKRKFFELAQEVDGLVDQLALFGDYSPPLSGDASYFVSRCSIVSRLTQLP